jgi:hypothetical protein
LFFLLLFFLTMHEQSLFLADHQSTENSSLMYLDNVAGDKDIDAAKTEDANDK